MGLCCSNSSSFDYDPFVQSVNDIPSSRRFLEPSVFRPTYSVNERTVENMPALAVYYPAEVYSARIPQWSFHVNNPSSTPLTSPCTTPPRRIFVENCHTIPPFDLNSR